jgi:hypothetical protein
MVNGSKSFEDHDQIKPSPGRLGISCHFDFSSVYCGVGVRPPPSRRNGAIRKAATARGLRFAADGCI